MIDFSMMKYAMALPKYYSQEKRLLLLVIVSTAIHLGLLTTWKKFKTIQTTNFSTQLPPKKSFDVKQISQQELKKLKKFRTWGVKNGKKEWSIPLVNKKRPKASGDKPRSKRPQMDAIDFSKLAVKEVVPPGPNISSRTTKERPSPELLAARRQAYYKKQILKQKVVRESNLRAIDPRVAANADFDLQFDLPEGTTLDELNSSEKKFFSFQKRTFTTYVHSFISTYQSEILSHPQIKYHMNQGNHLLTGRIIFDKEGNIISVKIIKSSPSDEIHNLFEKTLIGIHKLPNPPLELVGDREEFAIYYVFKVGGN